MAAKSSGYVDLTATSYALDTTGSITFIATVPTGTSVITRVGKRITWKSIQIRGNIVGNSAAVVNDVAVIFVYDRRPRGAVPAITDVLLSADSKAFNNDANSGRFQILRRFDLSCVGNTTSAANSTESTLISFDQFIDMKSKKCTFMAAGSGAIADVSEGALYMITVGSNVAGTSAATLNVGVRTRFVDVAG